MLRWMPSISAATRSILNGTIRCTHGPQSSNSYFCLSPKIRLVFAAQKADDASHVDRIEPAEGHLAEIGTILPNSGSLGIVVCNGTAGLDILRRSATL